MNDIIARLAIRWALTPYLVRLGVLIVGGSSAAILIALTIEKT